MYGVTGTNGKTTTAYLINSALTALGHTTGLIGTVETRIGDERIKSVRTTPEATVLHALLAVMTERRIDSCVMEVSSHALSQHRVDGVVYDVALFTNLSQDHLDFHPTMRDYFLAKAEPVHARSASRTRHRLRRRRVGPRAGRARRRCRCTTLTSLADVDADWRLRGGRGRPGRRSPSSDGATTLHLRSALPGDFNRVNTAMAALALLAGGDRPARRRAGAARRPARARPDGAGRRSRRAAEARTCRSSSSTTRTPPTRWRRRSRRCAPRRPARLVVVLGAGGDRDRGKRAAMGARRRASADLVVVTDDNPRSEDPAAIRAAVLDGARAGRAPRPCCTRSAGRAAGHRRRPSAPPTTPARAASSPSSARATRPARRSPGTVHPFDDRGRGARRALRRALVEPEHDQVAAR